MQIVGTTMAQPTKIRTKIINLFKQTATKNGQLVTLA